MTVRSTSAILHPQAGIGEFPLSADDLRRIAALGASLLGLELGDGKRHMIYSRLSRRLRLLGMPSFKAYLDFLEAPAGWDEQEHFANALTTNLTSFFRESHHFDHFERELLRVVPTDLKRRFHVWSAGCSTGEEPYSAAMVMHAQSLALSGREPRILATDIDTEVLQFALDGLYSRERLRGLPTRFQGPQYLRAEGAGMTIADPVRDLVVFRILNLIEPLPIRGPFDAIFCRNVLIYFSPELRLRLIDRMTRLLRVGGALYLGHSESIMGNHDLLAPEGQTIYRRVRE